MTRGFCEEEESVKSMDMGVAVFSKEVRRALMSMGVSEEEATGTKCTLMKNFLDVGSPNCWESLMLRLCSVKNPVTAWTIPARSGHDNVNMNSSESTFLGVG